MEILFERTGRRRYAVEVRRADAPRLRMDPAPGFDPWFPHDLQHLIVEEQLGLANGIYGRLAAGGTASSFSVVPDTAPAGKRDVSRQRRRLARRDRTLASGANDFARSERATIVAWHHWLSLSRDERLRGQAAEMQPTASSVLASMADEERSAITAALPRLRDRISIVANAWFATDIGDTVAITWVPRRQDRCRPYR